MVVVIAHNIRSTHNIGSVFRTCDGFGVDKLYLTGYSPHPAYAGDPRLPHLSAKINGQIHKTALGAEQTMPFAYNEDVCQVLNDLKKNDFSIVALEQHQNSILLPDFKSPQHTALLLGEEVRGIEPEIIALADNIVEIPMKGKKESFNVSVAAGIALYAITFSGR